MATSAFQTRWFACGADHRLTRQAVLRGLGFIYWVAFSVVLTQYVPLLGERGLLPIGRFLERAVRATGSTSAAFWEAPSLFWLNHSDTTLLAFAWLGWLGSLAPCLGYGCAPLFAMLWLVYGSFVHVGQTFYAFGWEILLLEAGFLAIFLAPLRPRDLQREVPALPVLWLCRWLAFRLLFGAGLIKLRGDPCWTELTCLVHHYETQPNPHPLSWVWHRSPLWLHQSGVLFNHLVELVVPFGLFGPRRLRHLSGGLAVAFQLVLILSGNLSFLNWLSIAVTLACFDDSLWQKLLPRRRGARMPSGELAPLGPARRVVVLLLCALVALLSLNPIANLFSSRQRMNASYDPFRLVNTYGAFGSVGKERLELVIEGTHADPDAADAEWRAYEFPCKPTDPSRRPCLVTPFHYRFDWQLWFAAMSRPERQPWLVHFVKKVLEGDPGVRALLAKDPFPEAPPSYVRVDLYRYEFTSPGEPGYWKREKLGPWLPPLSREDPRLSRALRAHGLE